jgi:1-acyl-sn-glycerol-3-phosphate acyltransferase
MTLLRAAWDHILLVVGAVLLAVFCAAWAVVSLLLYPVLPASIGRRIGRRGAMWGFRGYLAIMEALGAWRLDLRALDALRDAGPLIIAPNHPCLLDAVLVVSRLPNVLCVMKGTLAASFLLGPAARLARYVRNDSLRRLITRAGSELREGGQLLVFPEGTRSTREPLGALTDAVGALSRHANVPVQAVIIESSSRFLGKGWPLGSRPALPLVYRVRLGRRFDPPADVRAFTAELERHLSRELASGGDDLAPAPSTVVGDAPHLRG